MSAGTRAEHAATATTSLPAIDPRTLTTAQRSGRACAVCGKRWPRPSTHVGTLPDGGPVLACGECDVVVEPSRPADERHLVRTALAKIDRETTSD